MTDREKVIKGLEEISDYFFNIYHRSKDREEINNAKDRCDAVEDALAMLKEQEPIALSVCGEPGGYSSWWYLCGKCGKPIDHKDRFCKRCGQAVKWE